MPSELLLETGNNVVSKCHLFLGLQKANIQLTFVETTENIFLMIINTNSSKSWAPYMYTIGCTPNSPNTLT